MNSVQAKYTSFNCNCLHPEKCTVSVCASGLKLIYQIVATIDTYTASVSPQIGIISFAS